MMRRNSYLGLREVEQNLMMKDELIVGEHQVDRTRLLIYIYIDIDT